MIKGSMVAIVTPMRGDGTIDYPALDKLIDFHISQATDAIVPAGTTGESATLRFAEHCELVAHVVEHVAQRVPVIAGSGANSTREALQLTQAAHAAGATACLLITPYYNKPTQRGLYQHYMSIAEQVDIPQILYNVPGRTACDMLPATVAELSQHQNIVGIKEASSDTVGRCQQLKRQCGDDFAIYSGEDAVAAEVVLQGGHGVISVTANLVPQQMHDMMAAALAGDQLQAEQHNAKLSALHDALFVESNPIPVKWALARRGFIDDGIRLPLTVLEESHHAVVYDAMRKAGLEL